MSYLQYRKYRRAKKACLKNPEVRIYNFQLLHIDLAGRRDEVHYFRGTTRMLEDEAQRYLYSGWFDEIYGDMIWNRAQKALRQENQRVWRVDGSYSSVATKAIDEDQVVTRMIQTPSGSLKEIREVEGQLVQDLPWMG